MRKTILDRKIYQVPIIVWFGCFIPIIYILVFRSMAQMYISMINEASSRKKIMNSFQETDRYNFNRLLIIH